MIAEVVDASVLAALIFAEPRAKEALALLQEHHWGQIFTLAVVQPLAHSCYLPRHSQPRRATVRDSRQVPQTG